MTKSRTLRKAGAVALSLAMAFSIAGTTPAQAASKVKLSSTKGTITVGKTKKVTIKNTKKSNIKKVTFKYSNTKKRVSATRSGLTLKFKGKKAGTVTITSKITLKKAVAGKKTYSLKYKATVKAAAPSPSATPAELALESVESAVDTNDINVLIVYFNTAVDAIDTSEVQIRRVSDNQLFSVEKVAMAADKKSATVTLTGTSQAGTSVNINFLRANTEYKMIVTKNGKVAEKNFTIPAKIAAAVVKDASATDKTITFAEGSAQSLTDPADDDKYTVADGVTVDYFDIVGRTVTAEYDRNSLLTKITTLDETVEYGAITKYDADAGYTINDKAHKVVVTRNDVRSNVYPTTICKGLDGFTAGSTAAWAKVVLNGNGSVRSIFAFKDYASKLIVESITDTTVKGSGLEYNIKDYTIIKDNKKVEASAVVAGDVLFVDSVNKIALDATNKITGKVEKEQGTAFTFAGKSYDYTPDATLLKTDGKTWSAAELKTLKDNGTECTLYTDLAGKAVFLVGEAAAETVTATYVATAGGQTVGYNVDVKGINIETKKEETITLNNASTSSLITYNGNTANTPTSDAAHIAVKDMFVVTRKKADNTVTKIEEIKTAVVSEAGMLLDGTATVASPGTEEITKSVKVIANDPGSLSGKAYETAGAKVISYTAATSTDPASIKIYDFKSWTGTLTATAGVFGATFLGDGALSYLVANANPSGIDKGSSTDDTPFTGFVAKAMLGNDPEVTVIKEDGTTVVYTALKDSTAGTRASAAEGRFVQITPDKDGKTINAVDATPVTLDDVFVSPAAESGYTAGTTVSFYTATTTKITLRRADTKNSGSPTDDDYYNYKDAEFDLSAGGVFVIKKDKNGAYTASLVGDIPAGKVVKYSTLSGGFVNLIMWAE